MSTDQNMFLPPKIVVFKNIFITFFFFSLSNEIQNKEKLPPPALPLSRKKQQPKKQRDLKEENFSSHLCLVSTQTGHRGLDPIPASIW